MGLSIPSSGGAGFSASDIQLAELAPKIPKLNMFKNEMYLSAEQLFDMSTIAVNGGGTVTFDATHQQMQLKTSLVAGDWADAIIHLPLRAWTGSLLGFDDYYAWSQPGQLSLSIMYAYARGGGAAPSGSQRPFMNMAVEQIPVAGAVDMSDKGFGWNVSNDFSDSSEVQLHDGTALTSISTHPQGQGTLSNILFEHSFVDDDRLMSVYKNSAASVDGAADTLASGEVDKHYTDGVWDGQLHFNVGNWAKASSWNLSIGGVWLSFTQ